MNNEQRAQAYQQAFQGRLASELGAAHIERISAEVKAGILEQELAQAEAAMAVLSAAQAGAGEGAKEAGGEVQTVHLSPHPDTPDEATHDHRYRLRPVADPEAREAVRRRSPKAK